MTEEDQEKKAAPEPTHYLHLANGDVVDHYGAIPTHVSDGDKVTPVVAAYER